MLGFSALLFLSAAGFGIARWLRLPVIPLLLLLGLGLSFTPLAPTEEFTGNVLQLGLAFLLFAAGIELNPRRFRAQRSAVLWVGLIQFVFTAAFGFALSLALGFDRLTALYLALALASSSTLVVVRHLRQRGQFFEPFGRLVTGVLLVQDVLIIVLIVVVAALPASGWAIGAGLAGLAALGAGAVLVQRRLLPALLDRIRLDEEMLLLTVLAVLFAFVGAAALLRLPPVTGAFLAGFALSAFPMSGMVRGLLSSLNDFFLAIFFAALGALITLPSAAGIAQAAAFAFFVIALTPPLVTAIAEWRGMSARASIEGGLLLAQTSEFSLVVGLAGLTLGEIEGEVFSIITLVTVVTMTLTPFLATEGIVRRLLHWHPSRRRPSRSAGSRSGHVLVLGFGSGGMWVVRPLLASGHQVLIVDDDPAVIDQLRRQGIEHIRGDAADERTLERADAWSAKLVIVALRRVEDNIGVLMRLPRMPVVVRVFEEADAERIRTLGGIPILNSLAAADTFMAWFSEHFPEAGGGKEMRNEIRREIRNEK